MYVSPLFYACVVNVWLLLSVFYHFACLMIVSTVCGCTDQKG